MSKLNSNSELKIIEVDMIDDKPLETGTSKEVKPCLELSPEQEAGVYSKKSSSKSKKIGQMTFDDFKSVKIVSRNEDKSHNNNNALLRKTSHTAVSILKKKANDALRRKNGNKNNTRILEYHNHNSNNKELCCKNEVDMNG